MSTITHRSSQQCEKRSECRKGTGMAESIEDTAEVTAARQRSSKVKGINPARGTTVDRPIRRASDVKNCMHKGRHC